MTWIDDGKRRKKVALIKLKTITVPCSRVSAINLFGSWLQPRVAEGGNVVSTCCQNTEAESCHVQPLTFAPFPCIHNCDSTTRPYCAFVYTCAYPRRTTRACETYARATHITWRTIIEVVDWSKR